MKKFVALILIVVMCVSFVSCDALSNGKTDTYYKIGDTVSSDILEFTLDKAVLAIALNNVMDDNYGSPKEYNAQEDNDNPFVCAKGNTYATFTYTINNIDRTNYNGVLPLVEAEYKDVVSDKQVDCAEYVPGTGEWKSTGNNATPPVYSWHFVLEPGVAETYRSYIEIPVEADNLTDDFIQTVKLPASDGSTSDFSYLITQSN